MRRPTSSTVLILSRTAPDPDLNTAFLEQSEIKLMNSDPGLDVLGLVRSEHPDLIIEDVDGSGPRALELCRQLKTDPETSSIPLILVTSEQLEHRLEVAGADTLLRKPLIPNEFYEAVRRYVPLPDRRHLRYVMNVRFTFEFDGQFCQAFSRDISLNGAFLKTDRLLPPGTHLQIGFRLPGEGVRICCGGVVRRVSEHEAKHKGVSGIGVEFEGIHDEELGTLERFLRRHLRCESLFG